MVKRLGQTLARSGAALEEGEVVKHLFQMQTAEGQYQADPLVKPLTTRHCYVW